MKRVLITVAAILIVAITLLSFQKANNNDNNKPAKEPYEAMWKQFKDHLSNSLPESATKVLDEIEANAVKDHDQVQLLKTIIYRKKVMLETEEGDMETAYLNYATKQFDRLDPVPRAVLHADIASTYAEYYSVFSYRINSNKVVDGDINNMTMDNWDKHTFTRLIDEHYFEALKPVAELKAAPTSDYLCLFEEKNRMALEYEPTMFDFIFHKTAKHYQESSTADDIHPSWNTDSWWLADKDFVKADLGKSDQPIIKCLKLFQRLISENMDNLDLRLYNDYKRYEFVNSILKDHDRYQQAFRGLMDRYKGNAQYPELANCLASSLIQQYEDNPDNEAYHDNYKKAADICRETIEAYNKNTYECKSTLGHITHSEMSFKLNNVQLPNENIPVVLQYRNVTHPYFKIYKVTEAEAEKLSRLYEYDLYDTLEQRKPLLDRQALLPEETDYLQHSTVIALPALEEGIYYILGKTDRDAKTRSKGCVLRFQVSQLGFLVDSQPNKFTVVTIDRKTGHPMPGVSVKATRREYNYKIREYETKEVGSAISDKDGRAVFANDMGHNSFNITLRKGKDVLLPAESHYIEGEPSARSTYDQTRLYTDRAIYRPGQTVYFKGIVVHYENGNQTLATNCKEHIYFKDANRQNIADAAFTTDEYGGFDGSFVIPTDLLNGVFYLNALHGSTDIRVEEYKRPTFEIHFDGVNEQYKLNQDVTVHGSVDAYAGFGLDDVKYTYNVVRMTQFPWRCWWWWYPVIPDETIDFGEGRTDGDGKFATTFNLKPSLKTKPEQQPVFTYKIEVIATSAQGETHSDTYYLRAGYNEIAISTNIPSLVEQSEVGKYNIEVFTMNGKPAKSRVTRKIYLFEEDSRINYFEAYGLRDDIDRQALSDGELRTLFPNYSFRTQDDKMKHKKLVYQDEVNINEKANFYPGKQALKPGKYYIELKSLDDPLAQTATEFTVFQSSSKQLPYPTMAWYRVDKSTAHPGETVQFQIGSAASNVKMWVRLTHGNEVRLERWITLNNDVQTIDYKVTENDRGGLTLQTAFAKENCYNTRNLNVSVPYDNYDLDVSLATVRDKLSPGAEETWTINVKDYKNKPVQAALLAGMYDASLDEFAYHYWSFGMKPYSMGSRSFRHDRQQFISNATSYDHFTLYVMFDDKLPSDFPFLRIYVSRLDNMMGARVLRKNSMAVEDEAVGYAAAAGEVVEEVAVMESITADAAEDDSATEETGAPQTTEESSPSLRENFNETAFFFPNLRTEEDGSSTFTFTLPDAITRWKLMTLAYTKEGQTGGKEYSFTASKPVMIMADMPRFMYDIDTLWLVANVINTGDEAVTPKAKLEIFDAATMKPLNLLLSDQTVSMQEIVPGRSKEVRWKVAGKYDLNLLAFRFTAYAGNFSDAEQHLLPVLSSEIFLTQTLPITVMAETEKTFDFEAIANPKSHERDYSLTLNFSTNPVWYAVQSLPYLANVQTNYAENAFYVFYANSLSAYLADHVPNLMAYIKRWQIETPDALMSQLEKDEDLKAIMLKETPWVMEAKSESEQRSRIVNLFDLNNLRHQQSHTLSLLERKQKYNGGWPWIDGMPESPYITTYILSGFGRLKSMGVWESMSKADQRKAEEICRKAVRFIENDVAEDYREMRKHKEEWGIGGFTLNELYALSFFPEQKSDKDFATAKKYYLDRLDNKKEWTGFNFNYRSYAAIVLWRNGHEKTAKLIIKSFKECAQKNEEIGMYWPKKYFSYISHVATHANIMAAFAEIDQNQEMLDQLRIWLLTQKRTNMWENSSSTADAIYALLMRGSDWFEEGKDVTLSFSGTPISTEGGQAGTGFIQRRWDASEVTEDMRHLTVNNPTGHLVWGGLFRQYFVPIDEVKSDQSGFKIRRELYVETVDDKGTKLVPVSKQPLKIGDKLTVRIFFENSQDMSFVFIKDLRAAGFEPIDQISTYDYADGMYYYRSNTDTDMEFFIERLSKGQHQLEYSMFVTKEGVLCNGYALIQCQYAPEFSAYSDGTKIVVGK